MNKRGLRLAVFVSILFAVLYPARTNAQEGFTFGEEGVVPPDEKKPSPNKEAEKQKTQDVSIKSTPETRPAPPAPAKEQEAAQVKQVKEQVFERVSAGDQAGAKQAVDKALIVHPDDSDLRAMSKLLDSHVQTPLDSEKLKIRIGSFLDDRSAADDAAPNAAIMATPIAFSMSQAAGNLIGQPTGNAPTLESLRHDPLREAVLKFNLKDFAGAEKTLTRKIEQDPRNGIAYDYRALARRYLEKHKGSHEDASTAIEINPKDGWARVIRALADVSLGLFNDALEDAAAALALNPRDANAYAARAQAWGKLGKPARQAEDLRKAAELDTQFAPLFRQVTGQARPLAVTERSGASRWGWFYAIAGAGVLLIGYGFFRRRSPATTTRARLAMRREDRPIFTKRSKNFWR